MTKPVRIQLSRKKGFDLALTSMSENGLVVAKVARPSIFGNPFKVSVLVELEKAGLLPPGETPRQAAVRYFRDWMEGRAVVGQFGEVSRPPSMEAVRAHLRGKNLACWCRKDQPCHADVLLEIANR